MKHFKIKIGNLLFNLIIALFITAFFSVSAWVTVPASLIVGVLLGFVKSPKIAFFMAIQKEIWENHIEEQLLKDNAFLKTFKQADKENIDGRVVHIPQAGKGGDVVKNREVFPAEVKQRTDAIVSYQIDSFTSDPIWIKDAETKQLSYDKRASVLQAESDKLKEEVAESVLGAIVKANTGDNTNLPSTSILSTVSDVVVPASADGATGNRKAYSIKDLQRARSFFIRQKTFNEGKMFALITAEAEAQMFPADSQVTATYMASVSENERRNGVMYKAYGFNIMVRSNVYVLDDAGAFKPSGAVGAATDDEGILFYNGMAAEFALGDITFFEDLKNPTYYGDIYSYEVLAGARAMRAKSEGLLVIKQAKTA